MGQRFSENVFSSGLNIFKFSNEFAIWLLLVLIWVKIKINFAKMCTVFIGKFFEIGPIEKNVIVKVYVPSSRS